MCFHDNNVEVPFHQNNPFAARGETGGARSSHDWSVKQGSVDRSIRPKI
jgi:hypothetical protein